MTVESGSNMAGWALRTFIELRKLLAETLRVESLLSREASGKVSDLLPLETEPGAY